MATPEERASELIEICKKHGFQPSEEQNLNQFVENHLTDLAMTRQVLAELVLGLTLGQGGVVITRDGSGTILISESCTIPKGMAYQLWLNRSEMGHTVVKAEIERKGTFTPDQLAQMEQAAAKPNLILTPGGKA